MLTKYLKTFVASCAFASFLLIASTVTATNPLTINSHTQIGFNYHSTSSQAVDAAYWQSIGWGKPPIRIFQATATDTPQTLTWLSEAQYWHNLGYYVLCGVSNSSGVHNTGTSTWTLMHDRIVYWGAYVQKNNICDEFSIGNEYDLTNDGSISTTTLRNLIRTLATDVKAAMTATATSAVLPITYAVSGTSDPNLGMTGWLAESKGDLDKISMNYYGDVESNGAIIKSYSMPLVYQAVAKWGNSFEITEFNVDSNDTEWRSAPQAYRAVYFRNEIETFKALGIPRIYIYIWRGYKDWNNNHSMKNIDGTYEFQWINLISPITTAQNFGS